jgi:hypothetical protein
MEQDLWAQDGGAVADVVGVVEGVGGKWERLEVVYVHPVEQQFLINKVFHVLR